MKGINFWNKLLTVAVALFVSSSCNVEDGGDRTAGLTGGGYPGYVKTIDDCTLTYDSQRRVSKMVYTEEGYTETYSYSYSSSSIVLTIKCEDEGDVYTEMYYAYLDDSGYITKIKEYDEGQLYSSKSYTYTSNLVSNVGGYSVIWDANCNITNLGGDVFTYDTALKNDANIDLNMFVTNSEKLDDLLFGYCIGFLSSVKGFRSTNMISTCSEEGCTYDVIYDFDSQGRIIKASWDKYGYTYSTSISYY